MNRPEENCGAVRSGTVLIKEGALLPEPLRLGDEITVTGWVPVTEDLDRRRIENTLSAAGWTFFHLAHSIETTAFGFDRPKAVQKALQRLVTAVKHEKCNALEIDNLEARSFWGFPYVSLSAHPRHIQKGMVLGSET
jgi:hypothetical protein